MMPWKWIFDFCDPRYFIIQPCIGRKGHSQRIALKMVVVIEEETGDTSTVIKDVDIEVLVRHFCLEEEAVKLMKWCDANRKRGKDVNERIESANALNKKGNGKYSIPCKILYPPPSTHIATIYIYIY